MIAFIIITGIIKVKLTNILLLNISKVLAGMDLIIHKFLPSNEIEEQVVQHIAANDPNNIGPVLINRSLNPSICKRESSLSLPIKTNNKTAIIEKIAPKLLLIM